MSLTDEIINEVVGHEFYSFTNEFLEYNKSPIVEEDQHETIVVCEFESFAYRVIPFFLKNAPTEFSIIVIKAFQENLYKTMAFYFDD